MSDELHDRLAATIEQYRASIEQRVREQIERHYRVDATIDSRRVVEIQIRQERERLELMADQLDEKGNYGGAEIVRELAGEWLSELEHKLKHR